MAQFPRGQPPEPARRHVALPHRTYHWRKARMPDDSTPRSRRALLAAAAGGAAALAAQAALPLTAMAADPNDVVLGSANRHDDATSDHEFGGWRRRLRCGGRPGSAYGVEATSTGGAGSFAWSMSAPPWWDRQQHGPYTGAYGYVSDTSPIRTSLPSVSGGQPGLGRLRQRRRWRLRLRRHRCDR